MPPKPQRRFYPVLSRRAEYPKKRNGATYVYGHYRQVIEEDCLFRCFYCDCHEVENGGKPNMRLDHFRPKGLPAFAALTNEPTNLVYACHHCNQKKWDHWPAGFSGPCHQDGKGFLDGFAVDRLEYFRVDRRGKLHGKKGPADYMIALLELNRPLLKQLRARRFLADDLTALESLAVSIASTQPNESHAIKRVVCSLRKLLV